MPVSGLVHQKKLLHRVRLQDRQAFEQLYLHFYPRLRAFVITYVKSPVVAEDIVQDVFLTLWEKCEQIDPDQNFTAYLFTITKHLIFKFLKQAAQHPALADEILINLHPSDDTAYQAAEWKELQAQIAEALRNLPPRRREVFMLCREQNLTYDQVAVRLCISRNTVKEHMVEAMRSIRAFLRQNALPLLLWAYATLPLPIFF